MYKITIVKTRPMTEEEYKDHRRTVNGGYPMPQDFGIQNTVEERQLETTLTDEEFEKVRKAVIGVI